MKTLIVLLIVGFTQFSFASTVVLLNGMTETNSWKKTNILSSLSSKHNVKLLRLPYRESIQAQSAYLNRFLNQIDGDIVLVGHSAGGVVARNVLVRSNNKNIKSLITIASPHSGSTLAGIGSILNEKIPFGNMFSKVMLPKEHSAYILMRQLNKGSVFLNSLNHLNHPRACYVSIIKTGGIANNAYANVDSQNLNNVFGIDKSGIKSGLSFSNTGHSLHPSDAIHIHNSILACSDRV